ncbi:Chemotaxis protein CheW [Meiothermus luteus]|jgi:purine-binding chemotaxis protein CheW|uniref:Chemotaxis protein CheW n=1 Tax=Meiothermus luteus TaxID=2026184 RepID=A0A399EPP9_9DEIN|nr:chemotaxis protein CheW [Meiothermus luteus]RIH84492.1 Chemotaxis protein CheW [Meiothermus luteus]RMH53786.1 MAG: chemotaxis protein CheW [Deinococcota bacterium]
MTPAAFQSIWVLRLGEAFLGVEPKALKEVLEVDQLTPVPLVPRPLLGLFAYQGQVIPLFDLSQVLNATPARPGLAALVDAAGQPLAFWIDEVVGLIRILSETRPSETPVLSGLVEEEGRLIGLLDVGRLLTYLSQEVFPPTPLLRPSLQGQVERS